MRIMRKFLSLLLCVSMVTSLVGPLSVWAAEPPLPDNLENLITESSTVTVSSEENPNNPTAHYAIDGITDQPKQWASGPMKNGVTTVDAPQTPQWLTVDLGEDVTEPVAIEAIKLWYNMKVWPMVYEIQTSSDNGVADAWTTLVRVERTPFDGAVKNGEG